MASVFPVEELAVEPAALGQTVGATTCKAKQSDVGEWPCHSDTTFVLSSSHGETGESLACFFLRKMIQKGSALLETAIILIHSWLESWTSTSTQQRLKNNSVVMLLHLQRC